MSGFRLKREENSNEIPNSSPSLHSVGRRGLLRIYVKVPLSQAAPFIICVVCFSGTVSLSILFFVSCESRYLHQHASDIHRSKGQGYIQQPVQEKEQKLSEEMTDRLFTEMQKCADQIDDEE